ncbi:hypothetical protein ACFX2C_002367 [Malus domestica]
MLSSCPFLCSCSSLQDEEKESNQSALAIKLPVRNRLLGIPSLIAYLALLSSTHLQLLMYFRRRYQMPGEHIRQVKMIHRSMWRQAQQMHVRIHPLLLQKQKYLISSGMKAKVSHIMLFPVFPFALALTCKTMRKKAISQNPKSNF